MAYFPGNSNNFAFTTDTYQPNTDFRFFPQAEYAFIPPPSLINSFQSQWQKGQVQNNRKNVLYRHSLTVNSQRQLSSNTADRREGSPNGLFWSKVPDVQISVQSRHGHSQIRFSQSDLHLHQPPAKALTQESLWDDSIQPGDQQTTERWNDGIATDQFQTERFNRVDEYRSISEQVITGYTVAPASLLDFTFEGNRYSPPLAPAVYFRLGNIPINRAIQPKDSRRYSGYSSNQRQDEPVIIPWGEGRKQKDNDYTGKYGGETRPEDPKKPQPKQPDIRESYLLMNTISVVILPDRTPIEIRDLDISLDIDSFSWSFTGSLWGASSLALVEPDQDGVKQIEVDINGWTWVFIIERYTSNRAFGQERYTIYGASRTQLLAAPYAPQRSKSNTSNINAKQAISEELKNTGFTAEYPDLNDYSTPDWIIPGGTFSYQSQTPMKVIGKLVSTVGSVIIPARNSDTLNIQPRYPASPWKWSEATMDKIIPASLVISLSASWRPEPEYNAVYVSGTHTGVAVNVKRTGSAGNDPAPDILEDWLTETQVNTERGRNELSKGGHQSVITLEIPLTANSITPGLIVPGQLAEVQDTVLGESQSWRALCLSTSIRVSSGKVVQVIELERHYLSSSSQQPTPPQPETVNLLDSLGGNGGSDWSKWDHWNNLYYWGSGNTQEEATVNGIICTVGRGNNTQSNSTYVFYYRTLAFKKDKKYTVSLWLKGDSATTPYVDCYINSFLGGGQHEVGTDKVVK